MNTSTLLTFVIQLATMLLLSPLVNTVMKKWKANFQGRQGPPLLQGYYDILKYFRKETVMSDQASWLFLMTPLVLFASVCGACLLVPTWLSTIPLQPVGGILVFIYLLGLGRFFMVSAAMEPGSGFCGMAASREMMLACLIEPAMLLALLVLALLAGTTNLFSMQAAMAAMGLYTYTPAYVLALVALFIAAIAEMGRVPFDNPETHYELTMIHEGLLLDYSGQPLGLLFWATWSKQLLILSLLANFIFPWGLAPQISTTALLPAGIIYIAKLMGVAMIVVVLETAVAKMRLFRVQDVLGASFIIAIIALIFAVQHMASGGVL